MKNKFHPSNNNQYKYILIYEDQGEPWPRESGCFTRNGKATLETGILTSRNNGVLAAGAREPRRKRAAENARGLFSSPRKLRQP